MILFVDDDPFELELEKHLLSYYNVKTEIAMNGADAVALAAEKNYIAIVMDVTMPGMSGYEAAEKIHENKPELPIIALCSREIPEEEYKQHGMCAFLHKPVRLPVLDAVLSPYIGAKRESVHPWRRKTDILFDYEELKSNLGNDEYAVMMVIDSFCHTHASDCKKIERLIEVGDIKKARELLYRLYIMAGNIFCCRLYENALILYRELESGKYNRLDIFREVWSDTMGKIAECALDLAERYKKSQRKNADWSSVWSDFCNLCKEYDVQTTELFRAHQQMFAENLPIAQYNAIKTAVNAFNYFAINELLEADHV